MRKRQVLDDALARIERAKKAGKPVSVGLLANAADVFSELVERGITPDVVTDQTSAHDPLNGYLPSGWTMAQAAETAAARRSSGGFCCQREYGGASTGQC